MLGPKCAMLYFIFNIIIKYHFKLSSLLINEVVRCEEPFNCNVTFLNPRLELVYVRVDFQRVVDFYCFYYFL
jgi:hypothetical protein